MASRDIHDLTPIMQQRYYMWAKGMSDIHLPFIITCTGRSQKEQDALYAQGRNPLSLVNALRSEVGLYLLKSELENIKITWTTHSKHIFDVNGKSHAWDFAIIKSGQPCYDLKINVNADELPDYLQAGQIAEKYSLRWGGRFLPNADNPHIEDVI